VLAVYRAKSDFVFAVEAYEIALLRYHHLRIFIQHRLDDIARAISDLARSFGHLSPAADVPEAELERVRASCETLSNEFHAIQSYLLDYRIEVMNGLLGDLFDRQVPRRHPLSANFKTLTEVATPEAVAAEDQRRVIDAVTGLSRCGAA